MVSDKPVWVKLLNGVLNAKRLEIVDNGDVIRFDGGVTDGAAVRTRNRQSGNGNEAPTVASPHVTSALLVAAAVATAQAATRPWLRGRRAAPVQGQHRTSDQPVQIDAATLEVRDKNKMATFSGNVQVVQGDTTMKCQKLVVFYGQEVGIAQKEASRPTRQRPTKPRPALPPKARRASAASKRAAASPSSPRTRTPAATSASTI